MRFMREQHPTSPTVPQVTADSLTSISAAETVLSVELIQKKDTLLTKAGHLLGFDQIILAPRADAAA